MHKHERRNAERSVSYVNSRRYAAPIGPAKQFDNARDGMDRGEPRGLAESSIPIEEQLLMPQGHTERIRLVPTRDRLNEVKGSVNLRSHPDDGERASPAPGEPYALLAWHGPDSELRRSEPLYSYGSGSQSLGARRQTRTGVRSLGR